MNYKCGYWLDADNLDNRCGKPATELAYWIVPPFNTEPITAQVSCGDDSHYSAKPEEFARIPLTEENVAMVLLSGGRIREI